MFFRRAAARTAAIDERAHHAATSPQNDRPVPTTAQMKAGNYKHGHLQVQGLRIAIENPAGSVRSGVTAEGKIWRTVLQHHYGRLKGTEGADGDQVDVFIGPHPDSELVFVIDQVLGSKFDEHKVIVGAQSEAEAREIYLANYQRGWQGLGAITALPMAEFKQWLEHHDTTVPMATNRLPAHLVFTKARGLLRWLFRKADVLQPGSRGGRFYIDHAGHIRYGVPPDAVKPFAGASSARQVAQITSKKSGLFAGRAVRSTEDTAEIFRGIVDHDRERFWMLHLAENGRPLAVECISQGSINQSIVHPRETFKNAVALGTKRVAFVHNHPSEDPRPSKEDVDITERLRSVAGQLGIDVTHHVVVGGRGYCDVENPQPVRWSDPSPTKRRQLRQIEGQIDRDPGDVPWPQIFGSHMQGAYDVARVGRVLFDPGDHLAAVLLLDTKMKAVGIYPLAHESIDQGFAGRLATVLAGSNANSFVLVASADGPQWLRDLDAAHAVAEGIGNQVGLGLLDAVAVAANGFHSVRDDGPISGARL
ncbi:MAG: JAB domain-containing protein [Deltaproteobacteria bacterium]|nr:JAB domain-containing protein [Deltaproteobacteria bacterium]